MWRQHLGCWILWLMMTTAPLVWAHPVAQGSIVLEVNDSLLLLHARVASEQVIVANAFAADDAQAQSLAELLRAHGEYLCQHIRLFANQQRLRLTLQSAPESMSGDHLDFVLQAALSQPSPPVRFRIEQDVLNEFEFAPGNPWEATYVLRVQSEGVAQQDRLLTHREAIEFVAPSAVVGATAIPLDVVDAVSTEGSYFGALFSDYVKLGVTHILGGYDHLLFVCALVLAVFRLWDLVKIVTVFTLAHSLTLVLSVLDVVRLGPSIVEPMIALSIVVMALLNILYKERGRGNLRLAIAFGFGLFHGLGFAGGIQESMQSLSSASVGWAILAFCIGVEMGHQIVVLPLFMLLQLIRQRVQRGAQSPEPGGRLLRGKTVDGRHGSALPAALPVHSRLLTTYSSMLIFLGGAFYLTRALMIPAA